MGILRSILAFLKAFFARRAVLAAENLALRHQLVVLQRSINRPKFRRRDRIFWVWPLRIPGSCCETVTASMARTSGIEWRTLGMEEVLIAPRSPWQNPHAERVIGSTRRERLDHVIVLNEDHLHRILAEYFEYYHQARAHLSLDRNSPIPRQVCPPEQGKVVARAYLGGLHHWYTRAP